jgi:hypothetical protein
MTDDRWLDSALEAHALRAPTADPQLFDFIWQSVRDHLSARNRRRRRTWVAVGFSIVFLAGFGLGTMVPASMRPVTAMNEWRAERWQSRVLDESIELATRARTLDRLDVGTPGASLQELRRLYDAVRVPTLRGTLLRTAMRLYPKEALTWVWGEVTNPGLPDITRLIGIAAVGPHVSAPRLVTLAGPDTPISVRYGVYEQLGKSPDPAATAELERLALAPNEPAAIAAINAALGRRLNAK